MATRSAHSRRSQFWIGSGLYGYVILTLLLPIIVIALWAFYNPKVGWFPPDIIPRSFSVSAWQEVLADRQVLPSALLSLFIAAVVTVATSILAFPTAWALAQFPFPGKRIVEVFILAPMIVPGIVIAISLGELFFGVGLAGTVLGVILVQIVGTLPLAIRILTATLEGIPKELLLAARTLGANPRTAVLRIGLPLAWPGFLAAGLLNFIACFEEFEKAFMVGAPKIQTLAVRLWAYLGGQVVIFPTAAVVTFLLLIPMLVIFFIAERLMREDVMAAGLGKL